VTSIAARYALANEQFAELGVDTQAALDRLAALPISIHCWQGDDVVGFEGSQDALGGGLAVTGNSPGRARTADELRSDLDRAMSLLPGSHRLNLHALYAETGGERVDRDALEPKHFGAWIDWAKRGGVGLDFNPSLFSHSLASDGVTLSHADAGVRGFWIEHAKASRRIGAAMGRATGSPCVCNVWAPDGSKDTPCDRKAPRERLAAALDEAFREPFAESELLDAVESKLFGIGAESYTVGSHEFYLGYAVRNRKLLCLDTGHFHPTEVVSDKLSAVLCHLDGVLLHVSRGVRWDSDHVVVLSDELKAIAGEVVRGGYGGRVRIGLDYFDATVNRVAAWVIGVRATQLAWLTALLEPTNLLLDAEATRDYTTRLALFESHKALPVGAVWDQFCELNDVPAGAAWLSDVRRYESEVLSRRT
jgi:L-rhamnose isomerase